MTGDWAASHPGIGVVVPHDMALDAELWRWTPPQVSLHLTRTAWTPLPVGVDMALALGEAELVAPSIRDLSAISPQLYVYGCTSGSFVRGRTGERELVAAMIQAGAPDALTTSGALLEALLHLGVRRLAVATPYDEALTELLADFLIDAGDLEVVASSQLGLDHDVWKVPYPVVADLIVQADRPDADAVVVSCTNLATYDVIADLERELGKPVVTANQATIWAALRRIGQHAVGPGQRLLQDARPEPATVAEISTSTAIPDAAALHRTTTPPSSTAPPTSTASSTITASTSTAGDTTNPIDPEATGRAYR